MIAYVAAPEECLHHVPEGVSLEEAAMTEPAAVALGAVTLADLAPGEPVVVVGPGPIGLLVLAMCRRRPGSHAPPEGRRDDPGRDLPRNPSGSMPPVRWCAR